MKQELIDAMKKGDQFVLVEDDASRQGGKYIGTTITLDYLSFSTGGYFFTKNNTRIFLCLNFYKTKNAVLELIGEQEEQDGLPEDEILASTLPDTVTESVKISFLDNDFQREEAQRIHAARKCIKHK